MGLLSSLLGPRREALAISSPNQWPVSQTPGVLFARGQSVAGVNVNEDSAMSLSGVFAAVNQLARIESTLPLAVWKKTIKNDRPFRTLALDHQATQILGTEFNPEMTAAVGRRTLTMHRLLGGNAYAEIGWSGNGEVAALYPIEHWRVRPDRDEAGKLFYLVDGKRPVYAADMIHVPHVTMDGICGRSFIDYAFTSLGLGIATQEHAAALFGNGAHPGGILSHTGNPPQHQRNEMRESWQKGHGGPSKQGSLGIIWGGWQWVANAGSFSPEQQQLLEQRKFTTEEVARWLNVPPHVIRDLSNATNNNIEQQGIDFVVYSIGPTLIETEQEYDRKLLNAPRLHCSHNLRALMRGDSAARATFYGAMLGNGVWCINDALEEEGMNPIGPDGDTHFVPLNMVPIDRAINPPEPPAPAAPQEPGEGGLPPKPGAGKGVGDRPSSPGTGAPAGGKQKGDNKGGLASLLTHTLTRLGRVEINALKRAAEKPGKLFEWMEGFYPKHEGNLSMELAMVVAAGACGLTSPIDSSPVSALEFARDWCAASKAAILAASESKPAEFAGAMARVVSEWESRPTAAALRVMPCEN
jgi:HK97 family phage portal protein